MSLIKYQVKSLQKICLDYITRPCSKEEYTSWMECPLFCLPFKFHERVKVNTFYSSICEPFICKKNVPTLTTNGYLSVTIVKSKNVIIV